MSMWGARHFAPQPRSMCPTYVFFVPGMTTSFQDRKVKSSQAQKMNQSRCHNQVAMNIKYYQSSHTWFKHWWSYLAILLCNVQFITLWALPSLRKTLPVSQHRVSRSHSVDHTSEVVTPSYTHGLHTQEVNFSNKFYFSRGMAYICLTECSHTLGNLSTSKLYRENVQEVSGEILKLNPLWEKNISMYILTKSLHPHPHLFLLLLLSLPASESNIR